MTDAHFQAVHVPAWIARRPFGVEDASQDKVIKEEQVLADLLQGEATMRVAAVMGEVGTGKSHLVRWLYAELRRRKREDRAYSKYHVVYIPKRRTTLKGIVDRILQDQEGAEFDAFKARLQQAQDGFRKETAPIRLRDELANSLRDLREDPSVDQTRAWLLSASRLPDLLQDPGFKDTILREDGVLARTVEHALERSGIEEDGRPRFVATDLEVDDHGALHRESQSLYRRLLSNASYMDACVGLLNETLTRAVGRMFDVGKGQIADLFQDVRAHLHREGKELTLFVEDFALLQGIELDLLEAIIAPVQEVDSDELLCPVRAAFAVTPGHFKDMQTVISRLDADGGYQYSLDAPIQGSEGAEIERKMIEFAGAYLNAARLGQERVLEWHDDTRQAGQDVPNHCEACGLRDSCRDSKSFGQSDAGYGLYPFNRMALRRIAIGHGWSHFDPRGLLKHMRGVAVDQHSGLGDGAFPSVAWAAEHNWAITPITQSMRSATENSYGDDTERAQVLLVFWGGETKQAGVLDPDIHLAFRIDRPDGLQLVDPSVSPPPEPNDPKVLPSPEPPRTLKKTGIQADEERLEQWRSAAQTGDFAGHEIEAIMARELRSSLAHLLLRAVANSLSTRSIEDLDVRQLASGIEIAGAAGGNPQSVASTILRIDENDADLLLALRRRHRKVQLERVDLMALLDGQRRHTPTVIAWLQSRSSRHGGLEADMRAVLTRGAVVGLCADADDVRFPGAYLVEPPRIVAPAASPPAWREFVEGVAGSDQVAEARERLRANFTVRQNPRLGDPAAVDSASLVPAFISALKEDLHPRAHDDEISTILGERLPDALQAATERLAEVPNRASALGAGSAADTREALELSMASVNTVVGGGPATQRAQRALAELGELDLGALAEKCAAAVAAPTTQQQVAALARVPWDEIAALDKVVEAVSDYIDDVERRLRDHRADPEASPAAAREDALGRCESLLEALGDVGDVLAGNAHA